MLIKHFKDPQFVSLLVITFLLLAASMFTQRWIGVHLPAWLAYINIGALIVFIVCIVNLPFWPARFMWAYTVLGLSILSVSFHKVVENPFRLTLTVLFLLVPAWVAIGASWFTKGQIWAKLFKDPEFLGVLAVALLLIPVVIFSQLPGAQQQIEAHLPVWLAFINIGLLTVCLVLIIRLPFRSAWFLWVYVLLGLSTLRASFNKVADYDAFVAVGLMIVFFCVNGYIRMKAVRVK